MIIVWKKNCLNLECFFTHETYSDIDCLDLFSELKVLKEVLQINESSPINVLNYIKRLESFPNACITFKILLTIPVTVAFRKKFFKIKINKILFKIKYIRRKIKWISHIINWKRNINETWMQKLN